MGFSRKRQIALIGSLPPAVTRGGKLSMPCGGADRSVSFVRADIQALPQSQG